MNIEEMYRQMKLNEAAGSRSNDSDVGDSKTPGKLPDEHTGQPARAQHPKAGNPGGPEKLPDAHTGQPGSPDAGKASKKTSTDAGKTKEDLEPPAGGIGKQADVTDASDFVSKDYVKDMLKKSLGESSKKDGNPVHKLLGNGKPKRPSVENKPNKPTEHYGKYDDEPTYKNTEENKPHRLNIPPKRNVGNPTTHLGEASVEELFQNFIAEYEAVLEENGIYEYDEEEAMDFFVEQYAELFNEESYDDEEDDNLNEGRSSEEIEKSRKKRIERQRDNKLNTRLAKKLEKNQPYPGQRGFNTYYNNMISREERADESVETSFKLADQLGSLLESEGLTDEFKSQATTIFEAAVNAASKSHIESIQEQLQEQFDSEIETYKAKLDEQVEKYLDYVVEEWVKENRLAVESASRNNIAESFMSKLKDLLEEHYVQLPEEKADLYEAEVAHAAELESELNESIEAQLRLAGQVKALEKKLVVENFVRELSEIEAEKIRELAEGVDFDGGFNTKLKTLKENFFPSRKATSAQVIVEDSSPAVVEKPATKKILSEMDIYLDTVNKMHSFKK